MKDRAMELTVPELSLVVLIGVTGSGKSTFARAHFRPTEVISSDFCRGLVADDENDQAQLGDGQFHGPVCHGRAPFSKTASWVGGPSRGSSAPTGRNLTR